jgi:hypothetical protein
MVQILVLAHTVGAAQIVARQIVLWKVIVAETEHVLHRTHAVATPAGKETARVQLILAML